MKTLYWELFIMMPGESVSFYFREKPELVCGEKYVKWSGVSKDGDPVEVRAGFDTVTMLKDHKGK